MRGAGFRVLARLGWGLLAMGLNGFHDLIEGQILLPFVAIAGVVARAGAVQAQEAGETVGAQFAFQNFEDVAFELLIRQLVNGYQWSLPFIQDGGERILVTACSWG